MNNLDNDIEKFKNREIKAKDIFYIKEINKNSAYNFVRKYHYLGNAKFFCQLAFGLFYTPTSELVGCATYSLPQGTEALKSWFNLDNDCKNVLELSRLCMLPSLNGTNATSYLLGGSIKKMNEMNADAMREAKRNNKEFTDDDYICRAVITLACSTRHVGSIYQVCNFTYYGMTNKCSDFYCVDGSVNPRGKTGSMQGVYLPRALKHRYAYIIDKRLKCNYTPQDKPTTNDMTTLECCGGTNIVYDNRFNKYYTCPKCTGRLVEIKDINNKDEIINQTIVETTTQKQENDSLIKCDLLSMF